MDVPKACSTDEVVGSLIGDKANLVGADMCLREDLTLSSDADYFVIKSDGCADHATFRDVKRADAETCNPPSSDCEEASECEGNTCEMECVDSCGNALAVDISGKTA
eukprot:2511840-Rhodomonas_salina.1